MIVGLLDTMISKYCNVTFHNKSTNTVVKQKMISLM